MPSQLSNLRLFRDDFNKKAISRLNHLYMNRFFANEIFDRIHKGRKIRSFLFTLIAQSLSNNLKEEVTLDICLSVEMSHAASVLVDDILDGDDTRHGDPSSQSILGTPTSALEAHYLCSEALRLVAFQTPILELLINTYQKLTLGEMYDVFLPKPLDAWICEGYDEKIYQKTSALFEYSFTAAALACSREELAAPLRLLGHQIGKLYQLSNDYYDLQPHNLRKRHASNESWRVTFSYPLAIYLSANGIREVSEFLNGELLSFDDWITLLETIWNENTTRVAYEGLLNCQKHAKELIISAPISDSIKETISELVDYIGTEDFWYHSYNGK
jgi:geranylgeranyl pyrophosphate synthase